MLAKVAGVKAPRQVWPEGIAEHYWEALPHPPPLCDRRRRRTFGQLGPADRRCC